MMRKQFAAATLAATLVLMPTSALAVDGGGVCVSQDAQEAVAATYETRVVTEAWVEVIEHPAETEVVPHDAVYETVIVTPAVPPQAEEGYTEHQYQKQVRGAVQQRDNGKATWHNTGRSFDWTWWSPSSVKWSTKDVAVLESGAHNGTVREWAEGNGNKKWREQSTEYRYVKNGVSQYVKTKDAVPGEPAVTEQRLVKAAWDETVVLKEAWTEEVSHPAVTEDVMVHPGSDAVEAVVCAGPTTEPVRVVAETSVAPAEPAQAERTELAVTGTGTNAGLLVAGGLILVGTGAGVLARRRNAAA